MPGPILGVGDLGTQFLLPLLGELELAGHRVEERPYLVRSNPRRTLPKE